MEVPGKSCKTSAPHQLAIGVKASLILSSKPVSWALVVKVIKLSKKRKKRFLEGKQYFMIFI